jgi:hypothetical protein
MPRIAPDVRWPYKCRDDRAPRRSWCFACEWRPMKTLQMGQTRCADRGLRWRGEGIRHRATARQAAPLAAARRRARRSAPDARRARRLMDEFRQHTRTSAAPTSRAAFPAADRHQHRNPNHHPPPNRHPHLPNQRSSSTRPTRAHTSRSGRSRRRLKSTGRDVSKSPTASPPETAATG